MGHVHEHVHEHGHRHPATTVVGRPDGMLGHRLGRRAFLTELGRRTFAVTILGAAVISCGTDDAATPPTSGDGPTTAGAGTTGPAPGTDSTAPALTWERVNLGFVSAYVLVRGNRAAVVDTGVAGSEAQIGETLGGLGLNWSDVDHVVLTHFHPDHTGSTSAVMASADGATAYAGEADIAAIQSPRPLVAVGDGDDVFGLQIIETPGHTAGHIAILDADTGLLIAGDAMNNSGGAISGSTPQFTADPAAADASVQKLAGLEFDTVLFGHGDPVEADASDQVAALASSLGS